MRTTRRLSFALLVTATALFVARPVGVEAQEKKDEPKKEEPKKGFPKSKSPAKVIEEATAYLKSAQAEDGTWSKASSPGVTGVVVTGLLRSGAAKPDDPIVAKGLKFIESLADPKDGSISGPERHKNYITSINLLALAATGDKKYEPIMTAAVGYFKKAQLTEEVEVKKENPFFGGFGYGVATAKTAATARPDLSNTHLVIDSLAVAGVAKDDPVMKKAILCVSRLQNFKSEFNDRPWAGKIDDGSFVYVMAADATEARPGYGSMTVAGIKSLYDCGAGKDDPRVKKALEWLAKNYSVDVNPGNLEGTGGRGYFYYLMTLTNALDALDIDELTDAAGKKHNWREEVTRALTVRQKKDGSWGNDISTWMETDVNLCTGYALITLAKTKPKAK